MHALAFDHIVLCVRSVERTVDFYQRMLGMEPREERPGKWSLHFGANKISLQDRESVPDIAKGTLPGTGNFCVLSAAPVDELAQMLEAEGVEVLVGPVEKDGATGKILSVYFNDPDGNLVEVSNQL